MDIMPTDGIKNEVVEKWEPVLEGIGDDYGRRVTAQLLENQAKAFSLCRDLFHRSSTLVTVVLMVELSSRSTTSINSHTEA